MFVLLTVVTVILIICWWNFYNEQKKKQLAEEREIQIMYYEQNCAFQLGNLSFDERKIYRSGDELDLKWTAVSLQAYNLYQSEYEVTLQEVIDYLDSEYAEDGTLMVLCRPESIDGYIKWYVNGGEGMALDYRSTLEKYLRNNGIAESYKDLSVEELQNVMPKLGQD